jgi:hypothetical protein
MTLLPLFVFVMVVQSALGNENEETRQVGFTSRTNDEDDAAGWTSNRASRLGPGVFEGFVDDASDPVGVSSLRSICSVPL